MRYLYTLFLVISKLIVFIFIGCSSSKDNPMEASGTGAVKANVYLEKVASLGKIAKTADISLKKGYIKISDGEEEFIDSVELSGFGQQNMNKVFPNLEVKSWTVTAWTIDQNDSIIHYDSTTFNIVEN